MEENTAHFQCTMLYYFKKGKDKENKICAMYGEGPVTDWTCPKCFAKFRAGDFSLDDAAHGQVDQLIAIELRH